MENRISISKSVCSSANKMESRPKEESDKEPQGVEEKSNPQAPDYSSTPFTRNKSSEEVVSIATKASKFSAPAAGSNEDSDEEYDPADDVSYLRRLFKRPPPPSPKPRFNFDVDPYGARATTKSDPIDRVEYIESGPRIRVSFLLYNLLDQHLKSPRKRRGPYISVSILDPVIIVERYYKKYYIAAKFNIEMTILGYNQYERFDNFIKSMLRMKLIEL